MKNSLIDREYDDLAGSIGLVADMQRLARFRFRRGLKIDFEPALFDIGSERDDAVTKRADKNFLGIERPHKCDIDVAAAFEIFRQANVLDAAGGVRLKPAVAVNFFPFDCDETVAAVRRSHA